MSVTSCGIGPCQVPLRLWVTTTRQSQSVVTHNSTLSPHSHDTSTVLRLLQLYYCDTNTTTPS